MIVVQVEPISGIDTQADANRSANTLQPPSSSEKVKAHQKLRPFVFKVKVMPYCFYFEGKQSLLPVALFTFLQLVAK